MREASSRILLDRTVIRLDGRPFFSFGPRIFLTPPEKLPRAMSDIAAAGFSVVGTPPASRGNLVYLHALFDEAERHGLLVILMAEPRVPDPSSFLAEEFKHRSALHSYCLPLQNPSPAALEWFCRERNRLRAQDLFHPIWTPHDAALPRLQWLHSVDLQSVAQGTGGPFPRRPEEQGARLAAELAHECRRHNLPGRPFFCHSFQTSVPDSAREAGLYSHDPFVRRLPPRVESWYPYVADLDEVPRRDLLPPDPELLRLRLFEILAARVRGIVTDYFEFLGGPSPFSGDDRFAELAVAAQEITSCAEFFSEGQGAAAEVETGHPRIKAALLQHSSDLLLLLWHFAPGEEYWIDPSPVGRLEVNIRLPELPQFNAWRVDFPAVTPLRVDYDLKGAMRIHLESVDLSAKVLLTRSAHRAQEIAGAVRRLLPKATACLAGGLHHRLEKVGLIETELAELGLPVLHEEVLRTSRQRLADMTELIDAGRLEEVWPLALQVQRDMRALINRRMVEALATTVYDRDSPLALMRQSYYTLPLFHGEAGARDARAIQEFT